MTHNVTDEELEQGRVDYNAVRLDYAEGRVQLTKSNLFKQMYKFWRGNLKPLDPFPDRMIQWMLQSGDYIPSPAWIISSTGRGMDFKAACAMWRIVRHPKSTKIEDIQALFFAQPGGQPPFRHPDFEDIFDCGLSGARAMAQVLREHGQDQDYEPEQCDVGMVDTED